MQVLSEEQMEIVFNEAYYFAKHKGEFCPRCLTDGEYNKLIIEHYNTVMTYPGDWESEPEHRILSVSVLCPSCWYRDQREYDEYNQKFKP